jgi:superfamily II RNA helicase
MVRTCPASYDDEKSPEFFPHFEAYSFPLSPFQKWTIEGLVSGHSVLNCAHTGSGKTLGAEFAMQWFAQRGKKVLYTSPIKALSNQKFHELRDKYPALSFGICTGDTKNVPHGSADVVVMTTEILLSHLQNAPQSQKQLGFDLDMRDVGCVVFDEVHYINDASRGHVWEESILRMPKHVQLLMLSATIDRPEAFAAWCETVTERQVFLTYTDARIVPLTHYAFVTCAAGMYKSLGDKDAVAALKRNMNRLHLVQDEHGRMDHSVVQHIKSLRAQFERHHHHVKTPHVLNSVTALLVERNMLPAICFVLSRKELEHCATSVSTVLLADDSKTPYTAARACEAILRRLPNYAEYLRLPEYSLLTSLLAKGIGIHHAGMMPVFREMVELMFAQGFVKLLFATETFAVGINLPTKTVLFCNTSKFDGTSMRSLLPHEYTQMAGRAGRRGIDTEGHVIHLCNLFPYDPDLHVMMNGKPQRLTSKLQVGTSFMLRYLAAHPDDKEGKGAVHLVEESMLGRELQAEASHERHEAAQLTVTIAQLLGVATAFSSLTEETAAQYARAHTAFRTGVNKQKKRADKELKDIVSCTGLDVKILDAAVAKYAAVWKCRELKEDALERAAVHHVAESVRAALEDVARRHFVERDGATITLLGRVALCFNEISWLGMAAVTMQMRRMTAPQLVGVLSCFTAVRVPASCRDLTPRSSDTELNDFLKGYLLNVSDEVTFDLIAPCMTWCACATEEECKAVTEELLCDKGIFLGDFVKALLRIVNFGREVEAAAEAMEDVALAQQLSLIPSLLLKFVASNQSLYV